MEKTAMNKNGVLIMTSTFQTFPRHDTVTFSLRSSADSISRILYRKSTTIASMCASSHAESNYTITMARCQRPQGSGGVAAIFRQD
jgi:hypothetical protein